MTVIINKTDGTILASIEDGSLDTDTTNLSLIGRLYRNYGELVNENFVKLLENFANSSSPTNSIVGQLWYNTSTKRINVYRSNGYIPLANLSSSTAQPNTPVLGDFWYDTIDAQLKIYNGTSWIVIAPQYSSTQTKTGVFAETIKDATNANHVCLVHYQQNTITAIECKDPQWTPYTAISGLTIIYPGFNLSTASSQQFTGNSSNALKLSNVTVDKFVRNDQDATIAGSLTLANTGLILGSSELLVYLNSTNAEITKPSGDLVFKSGATPALSINSSLQTTFATGSQSLPSMSFLGNTNTGVYKLGTAGLGLTVNGSKILEVVPTGIGVTGNVSATTFNGNLSGNVSGNVNATTITTGNLGITDNLTIGSSSSDNIEINSGNINVINNLLLSGASVSFDQIVKFGDDITSKDGTSPVNVAVDFHVDGDTELAANLSVGGTINIANILIGDNQGRLTLNSTVPTAYANLGDFSLGATNGIRSYNSPKMWISFNGTLAGLAIYDSFNIDFVTRTSTNHYTFTTEYPITSGAMAVMGSPTAYLTSIPSVGSTSFSVLTNAENSIMGLVVLSQ